MSIPIAITLLRSKIVTCGVRSNIAVPMRIFMTCIMIILRSSDIFNSLSEMYLPSYAVSSAGPSNSSRSHAIFQWSVLGCINQSKNASNGPRNEETKIRNLCATNVCLTMYICTDEKVKYYVVRSSTISACSCNRWPNVSLKRT